MIDQQICRACIYDTSIPDISFDGDGVCNYCRQIDDLKLQYETGEIAGEQALSAILTEVRKKGQSSKYDCVIGVSGGTDSSYLLLKAKEWGLRPLAVHYDNTWNSATATQNIRKVTSTLGVDLYTYVIDNKEADDIFRAFFMAGVQEFDASTDIALVQVLRSAAANHGVKYILEAHSFMAEGVSPLSGTYVDGKYIADVHRKYGKRKLKSYPNLTFLQFMKWTLLYRQKFIRPFWYIDYSKERARQELVERTGWTYYGGHHLENRAPAFGHTVNRPRRFNQDLRYLSLAAEVRSGLRSRAEALRIYSVPIEPDPELIAYVKKRIAVTDEEYEKAMNGPTQTFHDFKTYKKRFELLRPLFHMLAKKNRVPMSFYLKYCFPLKDTR